MENKQTDHFPDVGKKVTAVDWLIEKLVELDKQLDGRRKNEDATVIKFNPDKLYARAKQMEKEQIIEAATWGYISRSGEQYYDKTYGKSETER